MYDEAAVNVIVVNDGSNENLWQPEATQLQNSLEHLKIVELDKNTGKGAALRAGLRVSKADFCIFTDVDFPYTQLTLKSIIDRLIFTGTSDVVIGQRPNSYYSDVPLARVLISKTFRTCLRLLYRFPFSDTQCGIKAFRASARDVFLRTKTNRYLIDLEFLLICWKLGYSIEPINAELRDGVIFSKLGLKSLLKELISAVQVMASVAKIESATGK